MQEYRGRFSLKSDLGFLSCSLLVWVLMFTLCRALLLVWNYNLADGASGMLLARAFLTGVRFDLTIIAWLLTPLALGLLHPRGLAHRWVYRHWMALIGAIMLLLAVSEAEFYRQFHSRLNTIALQYFAEDSETVLSMIFHGSPVLSLGAIWLVTVSLASLGLQRSDRFNREPATTSKGNYLHQVVAFGCVLILLAAAGRGTLRSGPPLRWGDAFHSDNLFASHLGLNGVFTLARAAKGWGRSEVADTWRHFTDAETAERSVKALLNVPGDRWQSGDQQAPIVSRTSEPDRQLDLGVENVVFILMESFSGRFTGVLGAKENVTPNFDQLAEEGLLLTRFFSSGTHTHQGMFATFACFPNLPDYEYLMQQPAGDIQFSGLPVVMKSLGYDNSLYVYNGDFAWDNQERFFRKQGLNRFIGRKDFVDPVFVDPTWGVSDQDMFQRAVTELDQVAGTGKFFAMLQTLSNHLPYALPDPLPVEPVAGFGPLNQHLTAMRYSDWALGHFFETVKTKPWYRNTLFVIVGDHGFATQPVITDIDLLRFRVPALLIAPGIRQKVGARLDLAASQPDLVPTAVALLGRPFEHACWGRNLLAANARDPGFAVIKPSGSDKTIAMISGNDVLVKAPDQEPRLFRYDFQAPPFSAQLDNAGKSSLLSLQMGSYLQTALAALSERRAGE